MNFLRKILKDFLALVSSKPVKKLDPIRATMMFGLPHTYPTPVGTVLFDRDTKEIIIPAQVPKGEKVVLVEDMVNLPVMILADGDPQLAGILWTNGTQFFLRPTVVE